METNMANDRQLPATVEPERNDQVTPPGPFFIDLDLLDDNPYQPRAERDELTSARLRESIAREGQLQPILVRRTGARWQIIFGHGRVEALRRLRNEATTEEERSRFSKVRSEERPNVSDEQMVLLGLVENIQREDISPVDCATALVRLKSLRPDLQTTRQIANEVHLEPPRVKRLLRLDAAPQLIKDAVSKGRSVVIKAPKGNAENDSDIADQPDTAKVSPGKTKEIRKLEFCSALELAKLHAYWRENATDETASKDGTPDERMTRLIDRALLQEWGLRRVQAVVAKLSRGGTVSDNNEADDAPLSENGKETLPFKVTASKMVIFLRPLEQMTAAQRAALRDALEPIWNRVAGQPQRPQSREPSLWRWYSSVPKSRQFWGKFIRGCRELLRILREEAAKPLPPNYQFGQLPPGTTHSAPHAGQLTAAHAAPPSSPTARPLPLEASSNDRAAARAGMPEGHPTNSVGNGSDRILSP